jgi:putative nucleotidyltransferase with HDIG domain
MGLVPFRWLHHAIPPPRRGPDRFDTLAIEPREARMTTLGPLPDDARLAQIVGALSLATDAAAGFAVETALRTSLLAVNLAREVGVRGEELKDVYYAGLLRFIGCTAFAHEQALYGGGDDSAFSRDLAPIDSSRPAAALATIVTRVGRGARPLARVGAVARVLADPALPTKFAAAHCELAIKLAARLGMRDHVVAALGQIYERHDGTGNPSRIAGSAIEPAARFVHVAFRAETHRAIGGAVAAVEEVQRRRGAELDPDLVDAFVRRAGDLLTPLRNPSVWDAFLEAEPRPFVRIARSRLVEVARAFAHFVDLKSPFTLGHSIGVAALAANAARAVHLPDAEAFHVAALLHDIGRVSVPNGIWDKPGALNAGEWERVHMHAFYTERILARSPLLAPVARLAAMDHERCDGSGYHRRIDANGADRAARLLAACDVYQALTEDRAHRPARSPEGAARVLRDEAKAGRLARDAVEAVLTAAGQRQPRVRGGWPSDLSDREVEVLRLVARGLSNKHIAEKLFISAKTVQHHVAHIYEKTGIASRASAAIFAVENDLTRK